MAVIIMIRTSSIWALWATPRFQETRNGTERLVLPQSPPFTAATPIWAVISRASCARLSSLGLPLQLVSGLIRLGLKSLRSEKWKHVWECRTQCCLYTRPGGD